MPTFSIVMPIYNVEKYVAEAINSVIEQTYDDWELIIVDDVSPDDSLAICTLFTDERIKIVRHTVNKGLAGARNTGIDAATGEFVAFLDSDDMWQPTKLERHLQHLRSNVNIGLSFSRSEFIDANGNPTSFYQMPKLTNISAGHLMCRNPIGNGSAPVMRREALKEIRFWSEEFGCNQYFDQRLRQSEDIECWIRVASTTQWTIEGIPEPLTLYRLNAEGLSSQLEKQYNSWLQAISYVEQYACHIYRSNYLKAKAYQLRYLARQAIRLRDGNAAMRFLTQAYQSYPLICFDEFWRTASTSIATCLLYLHPQSYTQVEYVGASIIGGLQRLRIRSDVGQQP